MRALESEGIDCLRGGGYPEPPNLTPCFPTTGSASTRMEQLSLYPMQAETRRRERRREVIDAVVDRLGFKVARIARPDSIMRRGAISGRDRKSHSRSLERVAYASLSPRTHPAVVEEWAREMGYEPFLFAAFDRGGVPLYHTNVLMCVGARMAVIGTQAVAPADRGRLLERLRAGGREVIEISHDEIARFAGNMLELATWDEALGDSHVLVMSEVRAAGTASGQFRAPVGVHGCGLGGPCADDREAWRRQRSLHACRSFSRGVRSCAVRWKCRCGRLLIKVRLSYLLGSIVGGLLVGRLRGGVDIRRLGSGNAGGTNALRTQGKAFAFWVMLIDIGKGWVATRVLAPFAMAGVSAGVGAPQSHDWIAVACGIAVMLGHVYPLWYGFRGGKGVATLVGAVLGLDPWLLLPMLGTWLVAVVLFGLWGSRPCSGRSLLAVAGACGAWEPRGPLVTFGSVDARC